MTVFYVYALNPSSSMYRPLASFVGRIYGCARSGAYLCGVRHKQYVLFRTEDPLPSGNTNFDKMSTDKQQQPWRMIYRCSRAISLVWMINGSVWWMEIYLHLLTRGAHWYGTILASTCLRCTFACWLSIQWLESGFSNGYNAIYIERRMLCRIFLRNMVLNPNVKMPSI